MKDLFIATRSRLKTEVPALKFIDKDKGQLEIDKPPVSWPCALIKIQLPRTESKDDGLTIQDVQALVTVRLGFEFIGNTDGYTSDAHVATSLAYFDVEQAVYEALQGWSDSTFNKLDRGSVREEISGAGHQSILINYSTAYRDSSAA